MSIIAAGTTAGTALKSTGNTDGTIQLQVNGTTPSLTLATTGAIGVGSTPSYGTAGQALLSGGSGAAPTWGGAGALTLLQSATAATSSTISLTSLSSTYDMYMVTGTAIVPTVSNLSLRLRVGVGGTVQTASYKSNTAYTASDTSTFTIENAETTSILINRLNVYTTGMSFVLYIGAPSSTTLYKPVTWQAFGLTNAPLSIYQFGSGAYTGGTGAVTELQFSPSSSTIASGTFRLYGISNS